MPTQMIIADARAIDGKGDITAFTTVDTTPDAAFFVRFLDAGNALPAIQAMKPRMIRRLGDLAGKTVLDAGCGTGDDARALAALVGPSGRVIGLDVSDTMIGEAIRRTAGSSLPLDFMVGDAQRLDAPDGAYDAVRAERLLMHVPDVDAALRELVRVVRPGGRIVVFDFDWDGLFIDHPDRAMTRAVVRSFSNGIRNGWIGRQLFRRFHELGLTDVAVSPHTVTIYCAFLRRLLDGHLAKAHKAGEFTGDALAAWWGALEEADRRGVFSTMLAGYIASGTKA